MCILKSKKTRQSFRRRYCFCLVRLRKDIKQLFQYGEACLKHLSLPFHGNTPSSIVSPFSPTWTTGLETRRGLKVNLQPKERAESDIKETVMIGRSNNWPDARRTLIKTFPLNLQACQKITKHRFQKVSKYYLMRNSSLFAFLFCVIFFKENIPVISLIKINRLPCGGSTWETIQPPGR